MAFFPVRRGYVYLVRDEVLRLPPEQEREIHDARRPFLVLSGDIPNGDNAFLIATGCPTSKSGKYRTEFDVRLAAGEGGVKEKCWVRIHALQPVLKSDLGDCSGKISSDRLEEVQAQLFLFLDAL